MNHCRVCKIELPFWLVKLAIPSGKDICEECYTISQGSISETL